MMALRPAAARCPPNGRHDWLADSGELVELDSCDKAPAHAKVQRMRGGIAEIARKVLATDGMSLVLAIVYTDVL